MCVHVSGHRIPPQTGKGVFRGISGYVNISNLILSVCWLVVAALRVELHLDTLKQPMARRTLLLSNNQPQMSMELVVERQVGVACTNHTAYLRVSGQTNYLSTVTPGSAAGGINDLSSLNRHIMETWLRFYSNVGAETLCCSVCVFSLKRKFGIN